MRTRLFVPAAALVLAFGLSACGSDSDDSSAPLPTAPSQPASSAPATAPAGGGAPSSSTAGGTGGGNTLHDKMVKVAGCLRDRGYDAQDPPGDSVFIMTKNVKDQAKANQDLKECRIKNGIKEGSY